MADTATYKAVDGKTLRLRAVWQVKETHPANWCSIPGTLTSTGEPLGAWLISSVSVAPDVLVKSRSLGALTWHQAGEGLTVVIAVPAADPVMASLQQWGDLPDDLQSALLSVLPGTENVQVQSTFDALQLVRAARRMARLAEVGQDAGRATPLWQATILSRFADSREGMPHTRAEMSLLRLPLRYQEYVAQMLTREERILHFVPRPELHVPQQGLRRLLGRRTRHNQGILVVTDQQLLWMVDALPPMETVKGYGYIAKSCVLEHVTAARVREEGDVAHLELTLTPPFGTQERVSIPFPSASAGLLRQAVAILEPFYVSEHGRSLMRLSSPAANSTTIEEELEGDDTETQALIPEWRSQLDSILEEGEIIVSQAVVPAWAEGESRLLVVTDRRVVLFGEPTTGKEIETRTYRFGHISSAELSHSVMHSWLRLWSANGTDLMPVRIDFPLVVLSSFTRAYVAIRQGLVSPAAFRQSGG